MSLVNSEVNWVLVSRKTRVGKRVRNRTRPPCPRQATEIMLNTLPDVSGAEFRSGEGGILSMQPKFLKHLRYFFSGEPLDVSNYNGGAIVRPSKLSLGIRIALTSTM